MIPEEWGPFVTLEVVLRNIAPAIFTSALWATGHQRWLINNKKEPSWMRGDKSLERNVKPYESYLYKGLAWGINLCWIGTQLFVSPMGDTVHYEPIIDNVFLLDVGGVVSLLIMFIFLTSLYHWHTRAR